MIKRFLATCEGKISLNKRFISTISTVNNNKFGNWGSNNSNRQRQNKQQTNLENGGWQQFDEFYGNRGLSNAKMFLSQIPIIARFESCLLNPYSLDTALDAVCGVYLSDRIVAPDAVKAKASAYLSTALSPVLLPGFRCPQLSITLSLLALTNLEIHEAMLKKIHDHSTTDGGQGGCCTG